MTNRTVWTRLEPWARDSDLRAGLEARVHDPLWLLARQWQLGEFAGEDAASPIRVVIEAGLTPCSSYAAKAAQPGGPALSGVPYDPATTPIESIAECESLVSTGEPRWILAARAGLDFVDAASAVFTDAQRASFAAGLLANFPIPAPPPADLARWGEDRLRGWSILAGRAPHGGLIYGLVKKRDGTKQLLAQLGLDAQLDAMLKPRVAEWAAAYKPFLEAPAKALSSWVTERLQYGFSLGVGSGAGQVVLAAADHDGGRLDWTSFDVVDGAAIKSTMTKAGATVPMTVNAIPSGVQFPGMPNQRYWEFEDGAVNLGAVDASTLDLLRLLFLQFGLAYGNDFFLVPASAPVGSLCATTRFSVFDTFGDRHEIPATNAAAAAQDGWRMFALSGGHAADGMLWMPATLPTSCQGDALELVRLARDEAANMTWGIEAIVEGPVGRGVARRDLESRPPSIDPPANTTGAVQILSYNLVAAPPPSWIPLESAIPKKATDPVNVLVSLTDAAWGQIMGGVRTARLLEEAVPREGVEIVRRFEHARWIDGRSILWLGRSRSVGRGEITSGLRFDFV